MRYQSTRPKRQFLAGVHCPVCRTMDSVVLVQNIKEDRLEEYIECTACAHQEKRPSATDIHQQQAISSADLQIVKFKR